MNNTKEILQAWKNSRVAKRIGTEYPAQSSVIQGAPREADFRQYLTEAECKIIDKAIFALKEDNLEHYAIFDAIYIQSLNCNKLASIIGLKKNKIYSMLDDAERFIRGYIYDFFNK